MDSSSSTSRGKEPPGWNDCAHLGCEFDYGCIILSMLASGNDSIVLIRPTQAIGEASMPEGVKRCAMFVNTTELGKCTSSATNTA